MELPPAGDGRKGRYSMIPCPAEAFDELLVSVLQEREARARLRPANIDASAGSLVEVKEAGRSSG